MVSPHAGPDRVSVKERVQLHQLRAATGLTDAPVLVLVGGAGGLEAAEEAGMVALLRDYVVPVVVAAGATVVDGGTCSGVMRAMGEARSESGADFPLVGVAAEGTVALSDSPSDPSPRAKVDPRHTHLVLVPGAAWGDESPWLSLVASTLSHGHGSATLLINGGEIAYADAQHGLAAGRPLIVLAGSGRTADAIAAAGSGQAVDERARQIAASPLTQVVPLDRPGLLSAALRQALEAASVAG